jgi:flagellum-specific ATP synthase
MQLAAQTNDRLIEALHRYRGRFASAERVSHVSGILTRIVGFVMEARGIRVSVGQRCFVESANGRLVPAEVIGFDGGRSLLMVEGHADGLAAGARVIPAGSATEVPVGKALLGRVIDGAGRPLDGKGPVRCSEHVPLFGHPTNPMARTIIDRPLDVGVRAINALFTAGEGARLGLFAGSGVGKSVLLGMMARYTGADIVVVGLIGERGREIKEFIERNLAPEALAKAVIVAVPADQSALARVHGAMRAAAIAEYFRDQGSNVLLLMDSLTRFAIAAREIALAVGEMPSSRGYPPSVFGRLASLVERAGTGGPLNGSITAFYTVLVEGDDLNDPVADAARAICDGHIVLSRKIAERGHFPAIDVGASVSRVMYSVVSPEHFTAAREFRELHTRYEESRDMIAIGGYRPGHDAVLDRAVAIHPTFLRFLRQEMNQRVEFAQSIAELSQTLGQTGGS